MKTTVSLGRDGHCNEIRKTLSQALLTVALVLAAFFPRVSAQSCVLACSGAQISLDQDCLAEVRTSMLADTSQCPGGVFTVHVLTLGGDTIPTSPVVTEAERGLTLIASVFDEESGQSCWSFILVQDKLPPQVTCNCPPIDLEVTDPSPECIINCLEAVVYAGPDLIENCPGGAQIILLNETFTAICHPDFIRRMERTYTAVDASGNYADTCTEVLFLERIDFDQIVWPDSFTVLDGDAFQCDEPFLDVDPADGTPDAAPVELGGAGVPTIDGEAIFPNFINECNAQIFYEDLVISPGGCVRKVMRMWQAFEWHCSGETTVIYIQLIEIADDEGPELVCPDDITVSTSTVDCEATVYLPIPVVSDQCGNVVQITASYPFGFVNNLLTSNGAYVQLPVGDNLITYTAYDECFNSTQCTWTIAVRDLTAPVPICDEHTIVSLTNEYDFGLTLVPAFVFDDGSYDECGPVTFLARRMTSCINFDWTTGGGGVDEIPNGIVNSNDAGTTFHTYVPFACCDVGTTIMIELRVTDASGNINSCMVEIEVQDKLPPVIQCMDDITISCEYDFDLNNLSVFGSIRTDPADRQEICVYDPTNPENNGFGFVCIGLDGLAQDNCDVVITENHIVNLNNCGIGYIIRTFIATDPGGRTASCNQRIDIQNFFPFTIQDQTCFNTFPNDGVIWPCDVEVIGCGADTEPSETGVPIIFEDECDLIGVNHEDLVFEFVQGACLKILRTWRVIDWCQYGPDGFGGYNGFWEYKQVIKVINTQAPTFLTTQPDISECNEFDCDDLFIDLIQRGDDDCTPDAELRWTLSIDLFNDGSINNLSSGFGNVIDASRFFPIGTHRIIYSFEDGCGSETVREQFVEILSCKPPTPVCLFLAADLMPVDLNADGEVDWGMVIIWAEDFDASSFHACGYPVTFSFSADTTDKFMEFNCNDIGLQTIQIWVTDLVLGEQAFCTTTIDIQDNNNACEEGQQLTGTISGQVSTEITQDVKDVVMTLSGSGLNPVSTNGSGDYAFPEMPLGGTYKVMPERNTDWKNGVSTLDLIQIQKHLLGMQPLNSPYKMIAADANKSNSISAIDIVTLRRLILGVIDEVPENTSWRFVDASYEFTDPANPLNEQFPESYSIAPFSTTMNSVDFIGIKVGDVNNNVVANLDVIETRSNPGAVVLQVMDRKFVTGEVVEVAILASKDISLEGYQFTLDFNAAALELESFIPGEISVSDDNFNMIGAASGTITTSWSDTKANTLTEGMAMFSLRFRALSDGTLSGMLDVTSDATSAEAYNAQGEVLDLGLKFINPIDVASVAPEFELLENSPNPFSEYTVVSFITPRATEATITIYDVTGKIVSERSVGTSVGLNNVEINDISARGVLYCQVRTDEFSATRKMIRID